MVPPRIRGSVVQIHVKGTTMQPVVSVTTTIGNRRLNPYNLIFNFTSYKGKTNFPLLHGTPCNSPFFKSYLKDGDAPRFHLAKEGARFRDTQKAPQSHPQSALPPREARFNWALLNH